MQKTYTVRGEPSTPLKELKRFFPWPTRGRKRQPQIPGDLGFFRKDVFAAIQRFKELEKTRLKALGKEYTQILEAYESSGRFFIYRTLGHRWSASNPYVFHLVRSACNALEIRSPEGNKDQVCRAACLVRDRQLSGDSAGGDMREVMASVSRQEAHHSDPETPRIMEVSA